MLSHHFKLIHDVYMGKNIVNLFSVAWFVQTQKIKVDQ